MSDYVVPHATLVKLGHGDPKKGRRALRSMIDLEIEHEPINGPTQKPDNVRVAVRDDEANILALARAEIEENANHIAPLSEDKIMNMVLGATRSGHGVVGVIDAPDGTLAGQICLVPYAWWFSANWFNVDMFTYVSQAHRSSHYAADLIKFARWHTDQLSEKLGYQVYLLSGVTATRDVHAKASLYRRLSNFVGIFCVYPDVSIS